MAREVCADCGREIEHGSCPDCGGRQSRGAVMADATEIIRAIERGLTQREAVSGMPSEGPYPATTGEALAEVRAELAKLGLAIVPATTTGEP